jgi:hypothetical protein
MKTTAIIITHMTDTIEDLRLMKDNIHFTQDDILHAIEDLETMSPSDDLRCAMAHLRSALDKLGEI